MGPPTIRLQTGLYPPQPSISAQSIRPSITPVPILSMPPPSSVQEDRPQDAEQLQDALASAGVDLKAEEFNLSQLLTPSTPQPPPFMFPQTYGAAMQIQQQLDEGKLIFNRPVLSRLVDKIGISIIWFILTIVAKQYNIPRIDNEVIMLLSLTLEHRLRQLISQMCLLARHRTSPLPTRSHSSASTLLDLARTERQKEEIFQSRKRARTADKEGPPEKRVAPSSTKNIPLSSSSRARGKGISTEMTSEAQKRSTDTTVNVMLGGGRKKRYSWMDTGGGIASAGGGVGSPAPLSPGIVASPVSSVGTNREDDKLRGRSVERPGWITLKDALEAIEGDGGGEGGIGLSWNAGGKALWRGWARVKD